MGQKLFRELLWHVFVLELGARSLSSRFLEQLDQSHEDLQDRRLEEDCQERNEEFSQGLQYTTEKFAKNDSLMEVELLSILLLHGPLGDV